MLIYIKTYIAYSCFILIGIYLLICYIWPKPHDYQRVKCNYPCVTFVTSVTPPAPKR